MVPAAVIGLDISRLLTTAQKMAHSCGPAVPPAEDPGVILGTVLAEAARLGRNKVTIVTSPGIADFGACLEQLLAESTGKQGKSRSRLDQGIQYRLKIESGAADDLEHIGGGGLPLE